MSIPGLQPPPPFLPSPGHPAVPWDQWKQAFQTYMVASGASELPAERRKAILLTCLGMEGQRIFSTLKPADLQSGSAPATSPSSADELLANVKRKDSTYVLADGITAPTFNRIRDQINVKGWLAANVVDSFTWVSSYEEGSELRYADRAISPENTAFVSHTSGTTSVSKSIEVTQQSFIAQVCCRDGLRLASENDVLLTHRSITYFFGFSHAFFMVCCGGKVVLLDSEEISQVVDALISHNVTSITGNPRGFFGITEHVKLRGNKLPSLKKVISLGVKLPEDIAMSVASFFNLEELRDGYGMTEVSGFLTITPAREIASGDVGFPVPGSRMKIVDVETGESLGPMQCGEILFHTPYLMHGYYKNVEATAERIDKDGWLHTGKHSFARTTTLLTCVGRKIDPAEIEECLLLHTAVADAAVAVFSSEEKGRVPAALVVLKEDYNSTTEIAEDIRSFVVGRLGPYGDLTGGVFFTETVPRNGLGKIRRNQLPALLQSACASR
ncbi:hypothetical protein HPB49_005848 [Dermacentor silvarum]|uniref:Uncharacterized protein n=1 Tax=Dermacentor silvarum TaxID=543639 RepID=A0ACB8C7F7_DERSI|nr:hypothetical protein HPB49_005848 [Dermacentor silvarum]